MLRSTVLSRVPVVHGFGTRCDPPPGPAWVELLGLDGASWVGAEQVHGAELLEWRPAGPAWLGRGDALLALEPGALLHVRTADCVPVLLAAPGGVAAVHAGWRGTALGVVGAAVRGLCDRLGCSPQRLAAAVGPAIGGCCYRVGPEVVAALEERHPRRAFLAGEGRVDLRGAIRWELESLGVGELELVGGCTRCTPCPGGPEPGGAGRGYLFHSYRRDGARAGRQASCIGLA